MIGKRKKKPVDPDYPQFITWKDWFTNLPVWLTCWDFLIVATLMTVFYNRLFPPDAMWFCFVCGFVFNLWVMHQSNLQVEEERKNYDKKRQDEEREWELQSRIPSHIGALMGIDELLAQRPTMASQRQYPDINVYFKQIQDNFKSGLYIFEPLDPPHDSKREAARKQEEEAAEVIKQEWRKSYLKHGYKTYADVIYEQQQGLHKSN